MAKIKTVILSFPPSDSPDVEGYKMYLEESSGTLSYDSLSYDLGNNTSVDLATLSGLDTVDGVYDIGVTAVDDAGNESSMSTITDVPLDFLAPNPPGEITLERS